MGLTKLIAKDPYTPPLMEKGFEELTVEMHRGINWTIQPNGNMTEVAVEYDRHLIGDELIETALRGGCWF